MHTLSQARSVTSGRGSEGGWGPVSAPGTLAPLTFVVGLTGLPNGGYVASDVRIGSKDSSGRFRPWSGVGVQKVYPIGPFLVAGFSGSVKLGFWAIYDLRRFIGDVPEDCAVSPCKVARWWWRRPRRAWASIPSELKEAGLQVIIVGATPEPTPLQVSHGFSFRAPDFELERIKPLRPTGIGSGNDLSHVIEALRDLVAPESLNQGLLRMEVGMPMAGADALGFVLGAALAEQGDERVSEAFEQWQVRRGEIRFGTNEQEALSPGAHSRRMPRRIARSWAEVEEMSKRLGRSAAEAVA